MAELLHHVESLQHVNGRRQRVADHFEIRPPHVAADEIDPGAEVGSQAVQIAELDLRGTDLVVLSACSTSCGDANNGQGVMGMRSAFLFAGARTIVGSLFEAPNAETRQLMKPFYESVAASEGKLAALNAAKLALIKDRRETEGAAHPFSWASFILVGEP